jgi:hypothetical protein
VADRLDSLPLGLLRLHADRGEGRSLAVANSPEGAFPAGARPDYEFASRIDANS